MKHKDVQVGNTYYARVSGELTKVRIDRPSPYGGWEATNLKTGRKIHVRTARRLHWEAGQC